MRRLSGGNVQKVLVGREIAASPTVLMAAYPVRGLDINSSRSLYGDEQVDSYLKRAIDYVHGRHGAICATHPNAVDYWRKYDFDAVDQEPLVPLAGTHIEKHWLDGGKIAVMDSVDLFGFQRILANPAVNFVYLQGEKPSRDSVVKAIREHHTIAAAHFNEADVMLNDHIPGDVVTREVDRRTA